jgi:putative tricarboxylic transport membrane protein
MKTYDLGSSLFWLILSMAVCIESLRMGIGTLWNPGMGFIAFGAAGLLGILSLALFVQALLKKEETQPSPIFSGLQWQRVMVMLIALLLYAGLMPVFGYLVSTFVLMSFLFWIMREGQRWWWSPVYALLITLITYLVFSVGLNCQYPQGPFGF